MSGLEVVGVVLGVLPIVIEALSAYQKGRGLLATIRNSHGQVDELIHQLKRHHTHFYLDILELLREARVPEILLEDNPDPERCVEILQAVTTGNKIEQYLGPQLFCNFLEIIGFYETYLKEITSKLGHIVRLQGAAKDDLAAITRAARSFDRPLSFRGKLKFAIDKESLGALVETLGNERYSLGKLIRRVKTKRDWEASEPASGSKTLALALSRVRENACSLYWAACKCWGCDRHLLHTLMIRLEHRIPESKNRAGSCSAVDFRLCFPIEEAALQRIEVRTRYRDPSPLNTVVKFQNEQVSLWSRQPSKKSITTSSAFNSGLKVPSITVTETANVCHPSAARSLIRSICEDAQKARERKQVLSLELTPSTTLEVLEEDKESPHSYDRSISLADFLEDTAADADARMSPVEQTLLALNVVSSVLQLRSTMWYSQPWSSKDIKFPVHLVGDVKFSPYTPYIEQAIDPTKLGTQGIAAADLTTEAAKTTMLELAILLLEILHHKSITAWAARYNEGNPMTYRERIGAATRWLELSTSKLLPPHVRAVEECLVLCARSKLLWDNDFQRLYCENIIKPLQELAF